MKELIWAKTLKTNAKGEDFWHYYIKGVSDAEIRKMEERRKGGSNNSTMREMEN
jgi:hypothetical protein